MSVVEQAKHETCEVSCGVIWYASESKTSGTTNDEILHSPCSKKSGVPLPRVVVVVVVVAAITRCCRRSARL